MALLEKLQKSEIDIFKKDMQESFQAGAINEGFDSNEEMLPSEDIDKSLCSQGAVALKAVIDGKMIGGLIALIHEEENFGQLDFLYVKKGEENKCIGRKMWFELENMYPHIRIWETRTPHFEKRNIHFYINVCGFSIVEFFHKNHKDPLEPEGTYDAGDMCTFLFRKEL